MGRPRKVVDAARVEHLAALGCTNKEIAADQDVSEDTLERRFAGSIGKGKATLRQSLRARQFQVAVGTPAQPAVYLREKTDEEGRQLGALVRDELGKPIVVRREQDAVKPNVAMLIWLGKQFLGQADRFQVGEGEGDGFTFEKPK